MQYDFNKPEDRFKYVDTHGPAAYNAAMERFRANQVIEICNGHALRIVHTRQFGTLISVGDTQHAFTDLEKARNYAKDN